MTEPRAESEAPLGVVPLDGRGSLPYLLVHGESLVAAASWALGEAGAELFDFTTGWEEIRSSERMLVIHDPLCPLTPSAFLEQAIEETRKSSAVVVGVRPVTDTVKETDGEDVGETVDREDLMSVVSPVVLPGQVVAALDDLDASDLPTLVESLCERFPVRYLEAPALAGRVGDEDDLEVLTALSAASQPDSP